MNEMWNRLRAQVSEIVAGMSVGRRVAVIAILGLVIIGLAYIGWRAANPPYATLFSRLSPEDAGEIVAVLRDNGVPYRLSDNGTTLMVPDDLVYETRLALAGQGLPRGGVVGFEVFLETALGATDFDRQVRYNMALQGELTRTIREINGVLDARVHIVMPERRLFARDERPATASVFLQLRPGFQLNANQVRGIAHLIARSVEGLEPENITIVDNWGQVLSDVLRPDSIGLVDGAGLATRLELQRAYERELELRAQTMLETVYGQGRAIVRVNAELNFDMEEERQDLFEPVVRNEGVVRSSQIFEEESRGAAGRGRRRRRGRQRARFCRRCGWRDLLLPARRNFEFRTQSHRAGPCPGARPHPEAVRGGLAGRRAGTGRADAGAGTGGGRLGHQRIPGRYRHRGRHALRGVASGRRGVRRDGAGAGRSLGLGAGGGRGLAAGASPSAQTAPGGAAGLRHRAGR